MYSNDCTVLVCSCDAYEDLWGPFFTLFKNYWPDCPYRIILNTESKEFKMEGLNIECFRLFKENSNVSYGERMIKHLDRIESPYVLVVLDDFFFQNKVNTDNINKIIGYLAGDPKIAMFKLSPNKDPLNKKSDKYPDFEKRPLYGAYRHSLQIAVWRTSFLKKTWHINESPWSWEIWGTYRSINDGKEYYCLSDNVAPPIDYGYDYDAGGSLNVYRGKWTHGKYENVFKENGIEIDFDKRGWYKDETIPGMNDSFFRREWMRLASTGVYMYIRILIWRVIKFYKCSKGQPVNKTYMEYLRKEKKEVLHHYRF